LRDTIQWTYELLSDQEKWLFERLAVFASGWTLEAIQAVCGGLYTEYNDDVLDLLGQLVDKSLVLAEAAPEGYVRYRMLETIRQFAREHLSAREVEHSVARRHAEITASEQPQVQRLNAAAMTSTHVL
jgi:predicted ATPase